MLVVEPEWILTGGEGERGFAGDGGVGELTGDVSAGEFALDGDE